MILALAKLTFRECNRRAFPYAATAAFTILALLSALFMGYSFGEEGAQARDIALSAVFMGGLAQAIIVGSSLVRADGERSTIGLLLATPLSPGRYIVGRFLGLLAATLLVALAVLGAVSLLFLLAPPHTGHGELVPHPLLHPGMWGSLGSAALLLMVFAAAAVAASGAFNSAAAPLALFVLFLAGSLHPVSVGLQFMPDWTLFGIDQSAQPEWPLLLAYSGLLSAFFLVLAFIVLHLKPPDTVRG